MKTRSVLIVDDDSTNLKTIMQYLTSENENCKTYNAVTGEMALNIAEKKQPDLIIMDWEMPGITGIEAIKELKANRFTKDIPVIMATGVMLSSDDLKEALEAGAVDYIRKPIDPVELNARVNSAIKQTEYYLGLINAERKLADEIEKRKEYELETKNRELAVKLMQIQQKNEINKEIFETLHSAKELHNNNKGFYDMYRKLSIKLKDSKNDSFWNEFEQQFTQIHKNFYSKLEEALPSFTPNEKRLCTFLRLNLNTKEIALISNKSVRSIEIARTRLRDKLNLKGKNIDLNTFLRKL